MFYKHESVYNMDQRIVQPPFDNLSKDRKLLTHLPRSKRTRKRRESGKDRIRKWLPLEVEEKGSENSFCTKNEKQGKF